MKIARWVFLAAGVYGLVALLPHYFLEARVGIDHPPPITHPEYFYGFVGVGVAWQVAFLLIASDPARYRLMILPAILEKASFGGAAALLYAKGRVPAMVLGVGMIDLLFGALFVAAFLGSRASH